MTSSKTDDTNPKNTPTPRKTAKRRRRQPSRQFPAEEKAQAVLAAWTERLSQSEICRQLQINYVTFQNWQKRAMEGMLQGLEDHARLSNGAALSPRLRKLMEQQRRTPEPKVEERLRQIQEGRDKSPS
jgi:transposase-like protein